MSPVLFVLTVTRGPDQGKHARLSPEKPVTVGSGEGSELRLSDPKVLDRHCSVQMENGEVFLTNHTSNAGTYIGEQRVTRAALKPAQAFRIGDSVVQLRPVPAKNPDPEPDPLVGKAVGGYAIREVLGKGGMGTVYRGRAPSGQIVAVKILSPHHVENDVLRTRFYLEAKLAMSIDHPNIVRAIEVDEDNGRHFLVMEYVEGESLNKRIQREGKLPESDAVRFTVAVARALQRAHNERLIHRDVKPDNILVDKAGLAKLTDLGLAKKAEIDLDLTRPGRGLGTPHFMAPEQFKNAKTVDHKTDIYALGASLYVMVTGKVPFKGDGPLDTFIKKSKNLYTPAEQIVPSLGKRTIKVIGACMAVEPQQRPASAAAIADYLEEKSRSLPLGESQSVEVEERTWFVRYLDANGRESKMRGPESTIQKQIAKGQIGANAEVSQKRSGPYEPIRTVNCFREAIESAGKAKARNGRSAGRSARPAPHRFQSAGVARRSALEHPAFWVTLVGGLVALVVAAWLLLT